MRLIVNSVVLVFVMMNLVGCFGTPKPWEQAGFVNESENTLYWKIWVENGFDVSEAKVWKDSGLSAVDAKEWKEAGLKPYEAIKFKETGLDIKEAIKWKKAGWNTSQTVELKKVSFSLDEANKWKEAGWGTYDSVALKKSDLTPTEAKIWKKNGFNKSEVVKWKKAGFKIDTAKEWNKIGYNTDAAVTWIEVGVTTPLETQKWKGIKYILDVKEWKENGFIDSSWAREGYSIKSAILCKKNGISTVEKANEWIKAGYSIDSAVSWNKNGFNVEEADRWKKAGYYSVDTVSKLIKLKLSPEKAEKWNGLNREFFTPKDFKTIQSKCKDIEKKSLDKTNVYYTNNKCYSTSILVKQIIDKESVLGGYLYNLAQNTRLFILKFPNGVPEDLTEDMYKGFVFKGKGISDYKTYQHREIDKFEVIAY